MARLVTRLRVDTSGMKPLFDCMDSLSAALAIACFDGPVALRAEGHDLRYQGVTIARIVGSEPQLEGRDLVAYFRVVPTFRLALFATSISTLAPGVKVSWRAGWPHFSASDDDDPADSAPDPVAPEEQPLPA